MEQDPLFRQYQEQRRSRNRPARHHRRLPADRRTIGSRQSYASLIGSPESADSRERPAVPSSRSSREEPDSASHDLGLHPVVRGAHERREGWTRLLDRLPRRFAAPGGIIINAGGPVGKPGAPTCSELLHRPRRDKRNLGREQPVRWAARRRSRPMGMVRAARCEQRAGMSRASTRSGRGETSDLVTGDDLVGWADLVIARRLPHDEDKITMSRHCHRLLAGWRAARRSAGEGGRQRSGNEDRPKRRAGKESRRDDDELGAQAAE